MILPINKIKHVFNTMLNEVMSNEISMDFGNNIIANIVNIRHLKINTYIMYRYNQG